MPRKVHPILRSLHDLSVDADKERAERYAIGRPRNSDRIHDIKLALGCMDCGYTRCAEALDWDHRSASKKAFGLARADKHSWDECLIEMQKCDLVCANCHRERTLKRRLARCGIMEASGV